MKDFESKTAHITLILSLTIALIKADKSYCKSLTAAFFRHDLQQHRERERERERERDRERQREREGINPSMHTHYWTYSFEHYWTFFSRNPIQLPYWTSQLLCISNYSSINMYKTRLTSLSSEQNHTYIY